MSSGTWIPCSSMKIITWKSPYVSWKRPRSPWIKGRPYPLEKELWCTAKKCILLIFLLFFPQRRESFASITVYWWEENNQVVQGLLDTGSELTPVSANLKHCCGPRFRVWIFGNTCPKVEVYPFPHRHELSEYW